MSLTFGKKKKKDTGGCLWLSVLLCAEITCIFVPWSWEQLLKYASHWCCIRWCQASFSSFYTPIPITLQNLTDTLLMGTRWSWLNTIWIEQDHIHLAINFSYGPSEGNLKISMCLGDLIRHKTCFLYLENVCWASRSRWLVLFHVSCDSILLLFLSLVFPGWNEFRFVSFLSIWCLYVLSVNHSWFKSHHSNFIY